MKITGWNLVAALFLAGACSSGGDDPDSTSISGVIAVDDDGDGVRDRTLAGVTVFVDGDGNNALDSGEPSAESDADGRYRIDGLEPGAHRLRAILPFGYRHRLADGEVVARPGSGGRIIGGADSEIAEYPFMIQVGVAGSPFCGGSLLSDRFVLTAAHCSADVDAAEARVWLPTTDIVELDFEGGVEVRRVSVHEAFNNDAIELGHDVAVWELAAPIDLEASGRNTIDILTPETASLAAAGSLATVIGWGVNEKDATTLQEAHLPIMGIDECEASSPEYNGIEPTTQICAAVAEGGIDSCQGDSGGPLMVRDGDRWRQAGVVSWGIGCAEPNNPGVYARTSALSDWIADQARELGAREAETGSDRADFAVVPTTRPLVGAGESRAQLTNLSFDEIVASSAPTEIRFGIIADADAALQCSFDLDGDGPAGAETVACAAGDNQHTTAGYPIGIYQPTLTVSIGSAVFTRTGIVMTDDVPAAATSESLTAADPTDLDFPDPYYIDHYELTNLSPDRLIAIDLSSSFDPYLVLYNADVREPSGSGGELAFAQPTTDGARLVFRPEPGARYLVGVSSYEPQATGNYELRVLNGAAASPWSLPTGD